MVTKTVGHNVNERGWVYDMEQRVLQMKMMKEEGRRHYTHLMHQDSQCKSLQVVFPMMRKHYITGAMIITNPYYNITTVMNPDMW